MKTKVTVGKPLLLLVSAVLLSAFTVVFGAAPLSALREQYGRLMLVVSGLALVAITIGLKMYPLALVIFLLVLLVGIHKELEGHIPGLFWSGSLAIVMTLGIGAVFTGVWLKVTGTNAMVALNSAADKMLVQVKTLNPGVTLTAADILAALPSLILGTMIVTVVVAMVWGPRLAAWSNGSTEKNFLKRKAMLYFRLPSVFIWVMLASILGTFLKTDSRMIQIISENVFNVLVLLYFFQGFAIAQLYFVAARFSPLWQFFWNVLFLLQLFPIVGLIGFSDYWLEYRDRIARSRQKSQGPEFDIKEEK